MKRSEQLKKIHIQFEKCAKAFASRTGGSDCEAESFYKGDESPENLQNMLARIDYDYFSIAFLYTAHGSFGIINSILECLLYTDRSDDAVGIPLQFVTDYCNRDITLPHSVPLISNECCMAEAFDCLSLILEELWNDISEICLDSFRCEKLTQLFIEELYGSIYGMKSLDAEDGLFITEADYSLLTLRFTCDAYMSFLKGNTDRAIKQLSKQKNLTGFDRRCLRLWSEGAKVKAEILPSICENTSTYGNNGVQKSSFKEFIALFLCWIVMTPFVSLIYGAFYILLMKLEGRDSVYLMGPLYNLPFCAFFAFITSIIASYFLRTPAFRLLFKKDFDRFIEIDSMNNGGGADKFMNIFLWLAILTSFIGCILLTKWNINFKEDGFIDNSRFFAVKGTYCEYSDIDRIYYKENRENDFGDTIDIPSYVIVLNDGTEIDLHEFDSIESYEVSLLDHLTENGVEIEH